MVASESSAVARGDTARAGKKSRDERAGGPLPIGAPVPAAFGTSQRIEIERGGDSTDARRPATRVVLTSGSGRARRDITKNLICALAHALWETRGGSDAQNWNDAEALLDDLLTRDR